MLTIYFLFKIVVNECEFEPPVCKHFPCIKFNGTGYECDCTMGFHHSPIHDLTHCEGNKLEYRKC